MKKNVINHDRSRGIGSWNEAEHSRKNTTAGAEKRDAKRRLVNSVARCGRETSRIYHAAITVSPGAWHNRRVPRSYLALLTGRIGTWMSILDGGPDPVRIRLASLLTNVA